MEDDIERNLQKIQRAAANKLRQSAESPQDHSYIQDFMKINSDLRETVQLRNEVRATRGPWSEEQAAKMRRIHIIQSVYPN